ncbi:MAG: protein arginine kinase [Planctomycetaceae bacterium]|nr:protein arginine kinase [Planctomycetaceae bacterium]
MDLDTLTHTSGEWLRGTGPESDIVISSRIRLARNLARFPFPSRADDGIRSEIESELRERLDRLDAGGMLSYVNVRTLEEIDRQFLVERQLISRELSESHGSRGVGISSEENISVMINEEDHLRIQVLRSGFALDECWDITNRLDDQLEQHCTYAFSNQLGYLTACPTNVGTGIRISVMLHLPALVLTKEIQKVFQALQKIHLAVRGLYGEGSQAMGDFYQISNQVTLGRSEEQLLASLQDVVPNIIAYERRVRQALVKENRQRLHDQISRAYGVLRSAQTISSEETMHLLSSVRMGINLGLIDDLEVPTVNELFIHTQPAHLQKIRREQLATAERNVARASYLRQRLNATGNGDPASS